MGSSRLSLSIACTAGASVMITSQLTFPLWTIAFTLARWVDENLGSFFAGADPVPATLFLWHLAEEVEHKTVAFDVWEAVEETVARVGEGTRQDRGELNEVARARGRGADEDGVRGPRPGDPGGGGSSTHTSGSAPMRGSDSSTGSRVRRCTRR